MPTRTISLQQVRIAEPCTVPWDTMHGDDQRRFCTHCNRHVHNLSAMREDEAQRLVCESAGRLCIAYVPNEQGGVTSAGTVAAVAAPARAATPLEYAKQKRPRYGWRLVAMIAALGGCASALGTAMYRPKPAAAVPLVRGKMMVAGMMAPPMPATRPTTQPMILGDVMLPSDVQPTTR